MLVIYHGIRLTRMTIEHDVLAIETVMVTTEEVCFVAQGILDLEIGLAYRHLVNHSHFMKTQDCDQLQLVQPGFEDFL